MDSFFNDNKNNIDPNPNKPSTTFVHADPSNFQAVVQRLTGGANKLPISASSRHAGKPTSTGTGRRSSGYGLHERRKISGVRKLEISLEDVARRPLMSPAAREGRLTADGEAASASPVSTLSCPGTPMEEEEKAIAEKGFYLHPSPIGGSEPELLVLFPLRSPKNEPSCSS